MDNLVVPWTLRPKTEHFGLPANPERRRLPISWDHPRPPIRKGLRMQNQQRGALAVVTLLPFWCDRAAVGGKSHRKGDDPLSPESKRTSTLQRAKSGLRPTSAPSAQLVSVGSTRRFVSRPATAVNMSDALFIISIRLHFIPVISLTCAIPGGDQTLVKCLKT